MKKIVKKYNNFVKKTIFKLQNKTNNNFRISGFNKYLITFIGLLFLYLFYLLIPLLYDKTWVQSNIESKLLNEFKINVSTSADISYRILPAPHFLIKDSKILVGDAKKQKSIGEIKDLKVFLSQKNFFNKKKMNLKSIVISNANFSVLRSDLKLINESRDSKFANKQIKINKSNLFFKDNLGDIISIIKIDDVILFFNSEKLVNFFNSKGKVFNTPFIFNYKNHHHPSKYQEINFNSKSLKLNIFNESIIEKNGLISGKNIISFINFTLNTKYQIKKKLIIFESSDSKANNSKMNYNGELSINPFDLNLDIHLESYRISQLFNINPILNEFVKSNLLFNDNISINTSIAIKSSSTNEIFQNAKINFNIINGRINFNKSRFVNDKIGSLQLINSNLISKDNKMVFNSDLSIDINDTNNLFTFLNTPKSSRKKFKNIMINLDYDLFNKEVKFNDIKIDNKKVNEQLLTIIDAFNGSDFKNLNKNRRLINEVLKVYAG